jgi:hypothetical protein
VERWAELRREHFVRGVSIKELMRRTGLARNTTRVALRSSEPPVFRCPKRVSKLDPFKDEIHALLERDAKLTGVRVRELIEPLGYEGGKTIVDDYLREVRPLFARARTHQRTVYRPGEICQFDLWSRQRRRLSGTARPAAPGLSSAVWATRARVPARWSSASKRRTCCGAWAAACGRSARCPS